MTTVLSRYDDQPRFPQQPAIVTMTTTYRHTHAPHSLQIVTRLTVTFQVVYEEGLLLSAFNGHEVAAVLHTLLLSHLPLGLLSHISVAAKAKLLIGRGAASCHGKSGLCKFNTSKFIYS